MKREMQRDRPPPLRVNRPESKPQNRRPLMVVQTQALQFRQPLITHIFSPEVIQTDPHDFMHLVQRLTGQVSHVSPLAKKPRHLLETRHAPDMRHASDIPRPMPISLNEQRPGPAMSNSMLTPRLQSRLSPPGLGLQTSNRGRAGGVSLISPGGFEFSPSMLPSPTTFLRDFPSLLSPHVTELPSPRLARGAARSPAMMIPAALWSPGPLTSAFLADLPVLSPAAYKWIEKHPLSTEAILSPLPRELGLPPRPAHAHG